MNGDAYSAGDPVTPGALSAAETLGGMNPTAFPGNQGSRRLALANWLTATDNPLTARVMVNETVKLSRIMCIDYRIEQFHCMSIAANDTITSSTSKQKCLISYSCTFLRMIVAS